MNVPRKSNFAIRLTRPIKGSALVITLLFVIILTILILTFTSQVMIERQIAPLHLRSWEAEQMALMGADQARQVIQQTLAPLDDPFATTNRPDFFWALAPGRLDLFDFAATGNPARPRLRTSIPLHSGTGTNTVDLNARNAEGKQPIWQGGPAMPVQWVNVLKNPRDPIASATNPIVGRFAFWVDDEGAKINVNTADGTYNYTEQSYGQGTPSAVSLSVFNEAGDSSAPGTNASRIIAQAGRDIPYASLADIGSRPGQTNWGTFFATNAFNFTTYSRTPDFNLFNEPKFQLFPSNLGAPSWNGGSTDGTNTLRNQMLHLQDRYPGTANFPYSVASNVFVVRSIYPNVNQLTNAARKNVETFIPGRTLSYHWLGFQPPTSYVTEMVASDAKRTTNGGTFANYEQRLYKAMEQTAGYLIGRDPFTNQVTWPFADPAYYLTNNPTASKYNLRQIDSITLQTFGLANQAVMGANTDFRAPATAPYGILQDKPVRDVGGRFPHLTQVIAMFDYDSGQPGMPANIATNLDYGNLKGFIRAQNYMPINPYLPRDTGILNLNMSTGRLGRGAAGFNSSYNFGYSFPTGTGDSLIDYYNAQRNAANGANGFNLEDWPHNGAGGARGSLVDAAANPSNPSQWSQWSDRLLSAKSRSGAVLSESGIDFSGQHRKNVDSDDRASTSLFEPAADGTVRGRFPDRSTNSSWRSPNFFNIEEAQASGGLGQVPLGATHTLGTWNQTALYHTRNRGTPISEIVLEGGITYRLTDRGLERYSEVLPLDLVNVPWRGDGNNLSSLIRIKPVTLATSFPVIPLHPPGQPIVLDTGTHPVKYVVSKVRDPLLNQLPGDWVARTFDSIPSSADTQIAHFFTYTPSNDASGHSPLATTPEAEWVDMFSIPGTTVQFTGSTWLALAPQLTFPSVGQMQYIRTGAMPDNPNAVVGDSDYAGMPFRCLNFGPANTQGKIPDWAMLDLFTVPNAVWTKPSTKFAYAANEVPRLINLTYGGASSGKINLNGSVLFPWAATNADYVRPLPLAAQFSGLRYNTNGILQTQLVSSSGGPYPYPTNHANVPNNNTPRLNVLTNSWSTVSGPDAAALAGDIAEYIRQAGPLALSGQMCDIPAVNAYGAQIPTRKPNGDSLLPPNSGFYGPGIPSPDHYNRTRNDIVSQSIGNLVTQGNVFSIWTVGQVVQKKATNHQFGEMEPGDLVIAEVRLRVVIERALDRGVDGIPGNSANPGADGAIGSFDDPADPNYHPSNPRFTYRILGIYEEP